MNYFEDLQILLIDYSEIIETCMNDILYIYAKLAGWQISKLIDL